MSKTHDMTHAVPSLHRHIPGIGTLDVRAFDLTRDIDTAHRWLASDHATFWGMQSLSRDEIDDYFQRIADSDTHQAMIGLHDGQPAFLIETYRPDAEPVGGLYTVEAGDRGMHILVAPPAQRVRMFTWAVFALTVDAVFADVRVDRIVVEPDVDNDGIHVLNRRAGFVYERQIALPGKMAWLATCTRHGHDTAMARLAPEQARAAGLASAFQGVSA